jgi:hypothetical protein
MRGRLCTLVRRVWEHRALPPGCIYTVNNEARKLEPGTTINQDATIKPRSES